MRRSRLVLGCVAITTALTLFLTGGAGALEKGPSPAPPRLVTIAIPDSRGEIPAPWLDYPGPPRANVLLPAGYDPGRRYPLLIMLHGLNGDYTSYAQSGAVADFAGLDAIVVMPEGGSGWYTDWWNNGRRGGPGWESYELDDVVPAILARYPILAQRRYHAIAGVSMGGLGSSYLGGRLPGFFGSVASLSGFVDPGYFGPLTVPAMGLAAGAPFKGDGDPSPVYGAPWSFYARGHNPPRVAANLAQTRVFESTGTGIPSKTGLSQPGAAVAVAVGSLLEGTIIYPMNQLYHQSLVDAGVRVTYQVHPGGHDNPDFHDEIRAMLAWGPFKPVITHPTSWTNDTVATSGRLWDIGYRFSRPPNRIVRFHRSGPTLSIGAAGSDLTLTTSTGCVIDTPTPATVRVPHRDCGRPAATVSP